MSTAGPAVFLFNGIPVSRLGLEEIFQYVAAAIKSGRKTRICMLPVNNHVWADRDPELKKIYQTADLNTADGVPIVWISRLFKQPVKSRVTGLDLMPLCCKRGPSLGWRMFFLGASEETLEKIREVVLQHGASPETVQSYSPPYKAIFSASETAEMLDRINRFQPDILMVSMTSPKQDRWIFENMEHVRVSVCIGVGAAFDVMAGNFRRAPVWMRQYGLEWLYRLWMEPKRLYKRYLKALLIVPIVLREYILFKRLKLDERTVNIVP